MSIPIILIFKTIASPVDTKRYSHILPSFGVSLPTIVFIENNIRRQTCLQYKAHVLTVSNLHTAGTKLRYSKYKAEILRLMTSDADNNITTIVR